MALSQVSPVVNRGVMSNWLEDLPAAVEMLTVDTDGNVSHQSIPVASFGALTGAPEDNAALASALAGKSDSGHTHVIANVTGLQAALDAKLGGSTGGTDNRILRADGTGGATVQNSAVTIDDSGNISGVARLDSTRAGSMGSTNPQNQIIIYGGFAGYGIGFDANGELTTCVNSARRSTLGTHMNLGSSGQLRFNSAADLSGSWDTLILRNATGPTLETRSTNGLKVCNADGSDIAQLEAKSILFNSQVRDQYGIGFRSQAGYMTFYGFNTIGSNSPTMSVDTAGIRVVGKTIIGAANYSEAFGSETLKINGAITASGVVLLPNGSAAAPALAFSGDTDSGFYWGGANTLNIGLGGSIRQQFQSDGSIQLTGTDPWLYTGNWAIRSSGSGAILLRSGNGSTPATVDCGAITASGIIATTNTRVDVFDSNSGLWVSGGVLLRFGGQGVFVHNGSGAMVRSSDFIGWSTTTLSSASTDTALCRTSAGVVEINNGTAGTRRDLVARNITASALMTAGVYTVGTLPSAAANAGGLAQVTDSSVTTNGSAVAGSGANRVVVFSNGSTWDVVVA